MYPAAGRLEDTSIEARICSYDTARPDKDHKETSRHSEGPTFLKLLQSLVKKKEEKGALFLKPLRQDANCLVYAARAAWTFFMSLGPNSGDFLIFYPYPKTQTPRAIIFLVPKCTHHGSHALPTSSGHARRLTRHHRHLPRRLRNGPFHRTADAPCSTTRQAGP